MARQTRNERRRRWRYAHWAETLCVASLLLRGYRILARRYRTPMGEIDIVARRGGLVAFIEVKARRTMTEAAESLGERQRQRISRAASAFLQKEPILQGLDQRYDVMLLAPWRPPRHIIDAWREWRSAAQ